jgi:uncharacterized membrane protein
MFWAQWGSSVLASFLASLVECVEALTVVLAVGTVRGWRSALLGSGAALVVLTILVCFLTPMLAFIPMAILRLGVGGLMLAFGLKWLKKAVLRASGKIPMHDEDAIYTRKTTQLHAFHDNAAFATSFKIVMIEGLEVVFIVLALVAGNPALLAPSVLGALLALLLVILLGFWLHRPLSNVPENTLKFIVGILLSSFGTFWLTEGLGVKWPGDDLALFGLFAGYGVVSMGCVQRLKKGRV